MAGFNFMVLGYNHEADLYQGWGSNPRPTVYDTVATATELPWRTIILSFDEVQIKQYNTFTRGVVYSAREAQNGPFY